MRKKLSSSKRKAIVLDKIRDSLDKEIRDNFIVGCLGKEKYYVEYMDKDSDEPMYLLDYTINQPHFILFEEMYFYETPKKAMDAIDHYIDQRAYARFNSLIDIHHKQKFNYSNKKRKR